MPPTRKQQFHTAMETYVNEYLSAFSNQNVIQGFQWSIADTSDVHSSSLHTYEIMIPKRVRLPFDDVPDTYMTVTQRVPEPDVFQTDLNQYFGQFAMRCQWTDRREAYVEMTDALDADDCLKGNIKVVYKPRHFPYPVKKTPLEQLRERSQELEQECEMKNTVIQVQRKTLKKLRLKMRRYQERMQQIIRDGYEMIITGQPPTKEQCPVCISEIGAKENLMVPLCGHFICSDCMPKCEKCPICRDVYVRPMPAVSLDEILDV